jgi:hypothetical protein
LNAAALSGHASPRRYRSAGYLCRCFSTPTGSQAADIDQLLFGADTEAELRSKRLCEAVEASVAGLNEPALKERVVALRTLRDNVWADSEHAQAQPENSGSMAVIPAALNTSAGAARKRLRLDGAAIGGIICAPSRSASGSGKAMSA